jgi:hypothetical protein
MKSKKQFIMAACSLFFAALLGVHGTPAQPRVNPEPPGWYAGDAHVHLDCGVGSGHDPVTPQDILAAMKIHNLAVVSLLADTGNGEVRDAARDLPQINGQDYPGSNSGRLLHWDAEWHFDPKGVTFEQKVLGGHLIVLGLKQAKTMYAEYTYPIIQWAKQQNAIVGFAHMQYLSEGIPEELSCCLPLEYPVETALGTSDFLMEDVWRNEAAMHAYYRLLNCGFRPGLAAGTDFPCNSREPIGTLLTYVSIPGGRFAYRDWIEGIAKGRTVISTNGHEEFLDLRINESARPGDEIQLQKSSKVKFDVTWSSLKPLSGRIELVSNGVVVASKEGSASPAAPLVLRGTQEFARSGWLSARRMSPKGHQVHTAAVFITVDHKPVRASVNDAEYFVRFIDNLIQKTSPGGPWNQYFLHDLEAAQARYRKAREVFEKIATEAKVAEKRH